MNHPSPAPPRRGCRGCGCLLTSPLALLLTGLAAWLWLPQALRFAVFIVGGQEANPWPLAWATALIVGAQVLPRVLPALAARLRGLRRLGKQARIARRDQRPDAGEGSEPSAKV